MEYGSEIRDLRDPAREARITRFSAKYIQARSARLEHTQRQDRSPRGMVKGTLLRFSENISAIRLTNALGIEFDSVNERDQELFSTAGEIILNG